MNYRRVGRSGLKVSEICLGTWVNFGTKLSEEEAFAIFDTAVEEGIDFFDSADVYERGKAEEVLGRWMKTKDRRAIVIATKCRWRMWEGSNGEGAGRKHIIDACNDSLRRLQTDYIDLYQIHGPDRETPQDETIRALDELVKAGKIRYFGWSNYDAELIAECARISDQLGFNHAISLQNSYSMLVRDVEKRETPRCAQEGIGQIPFSPLAQGLLSDKYLSGTAPEGSRAAGNEWLQERLKTNLPTLKKLAEVATDHSVTLSQLALAWLLHQPTMTAPITGARHPEQVRENARASDVKLSADDMVRINGILDGEAGG